MLNEKNTGLIMVDVQGRLAELVSDYPQYVRRSALLLDAANILELPTITLEQIPEKLGPTQRELKERLGETSPYPKTTFSGLATPSIADAVNKAGRSHWLVFGIETHICVYQTACALKEQGYHVEIPQDCVSSRNPEERDMALEKMRGLGIPTTSAEMAIYELLGRADRPAFKTLLPLIK